ncbi:DUF899 family protein [Streptomyces roseolilacinus]|uniref:Uncharacterized protein n=1 Tax=Streptomyces roseolilacinus TaxID=66904 RepID=A0A918AY76_9ACTN|nr:DUF899 family protein [Streptomyces roseolilacinus]GGQ01447.1 hypothetical protein GCM10010249_19810 [Streptomyces roseolilacinus]
MTDRESRTAGRAPASPAVADRAAFQAEPDRLREREKAHTREGDAIAAARRRLPMAEVAADLVLTGPDGPVTLLEAFEGRRQLVACWTTLRGVEAMDYGYALMDLTVYGRQELWEDSPSGRPRVQGTPADHVRLRSDGRPIPQWSRLAAGRSGDLAPRS